MAFPTETVYGLGADASSPAAVHRLFAVKGRPADHPVIVHLGDAATARRVGARRRRRRARVLGERVLARPAHPRGAARARDVPDAVTGGLDTVGVRVPDQPVALALLRAFGGGVAAPSANRFGRVSPTTAADVRADLGDDVDVVLDGGPCRVGVESTIVDCSRAEPAILRLGGVTRERVEELLGRHGPAPRPTARCARPARSRRTTRPGPTSCSSSTATSSSTAVPTRSRAGERVGVHRRRRRRGLPAGAVGARCAGRRRRVRARSLPHAARRRRPRPRRRARGGRPPDAGLGAAVADRLRRAAGRVADDATARSACSTPGSAGSPCCGRSSTCSPTSASCTSATPAASRTGPSRRRGARARARDHRRAARPRREDAGRRVQQRRRRRARHAARAARHPRHRCDRARPARRGAASPAAAASG